MTRTASAPARRRRTSRPQLAGREAFETALREIAQMPAKPPPQNIAAEYLPRFVAKLRELGYRQDDIVTTIVGLDLGVTERQIRAADSAWSKQRGTLAPGSARTAASGAPAAAAASAGAAAAASAGAGAGGAHAGLTGARALRQ
jgi:hypothetical protein